ncbi:prepilin-type N-terminal cleavage/methylation domain-containing protein [Winogradskyella sp. 3972H.M.0a.05]|uniref:PulJ/GspJ family protein n=1 Tax=Winogradskyella sp. 3972H.M.0a.05 TaxID=2950277 RepID=UPI003395511A
MIGVKIKAFTILEVLISLVVMGIIIGLTYTLFNIMEKQLITYRNDNDVILQYNLLNTTLQRDIYYANYYEKEESTLVLFNYSEEKISYSFLNDKVLRAKQSIVDTFRVHVISHKFEIFNEKQNISKLDMKIKLLNEDVEINYFLKNDLAETINQKFVYED